MREMVFVALAIAVCALCVYDLMKSFRLNVTVVAWYNVTVYRVYRKILRQARPWMENVQNYEVQHFKMKSVRAVSPYG